LVTVHIILDQAVGYRSHYFGKIIGTVPTSLLQNDGNSNQERDPKWWEK
jgi:hypothetical protein